MIVIGAGLLWLLFAPKWGFIHYQRIRGQIETLTRENESLELRNAQLKEEIDRLQSDDASLEELARKKYGMLKENEMVYEYSPPRKKK